MKFRPTKLLTTVRPFAASNNTRSAAKSHFAFQPAPEFAKTATARASRVAVTLKGGGFSGSILTPSGKLRIQSRTAPRFGDQLPPSVRSQPRRRERSTAQHLGLSSGGGRDPYVRIDRGDRHRYGGPHRNQTPHGDRETSDPLPCRRSLVDEGGGEREGQFRAIDTQWGPGMSFGQTTRSARSSTRSPTF